MKKISLLLLCASLFGSCTKPSNTTNNYTTQIPPSIPAFTVAGITDITIFHNGGTAVMPLIIQYQDSVQQEVTVSVSGIPTGNSGTQNGTLVKGIPTFNTSLSFYSNPIAVGVYPITITCAGTMSGTKTFSFNLTVN